MNYAELVDRRIGEIKKEYEGDLEKFVRDIVFFGGKPEQSNYKLWGLTDIINGMNFGTLAHKYGVDDSSDKFYCCGGLLKRKIQKNED